MFAVRSMTARPAVRPAKAGGRRSVARRAEGESAPDAAPVPAPAAPAAAPMAMVSMRAGVWVDKLGRGAGEGALGVGGDSGRTI